MFDYQISSIASKKGVFNPMQLLHIPMNTWQTLFSFMCPIFGCQKDDGFGQKVKKT